MPAIPSDIAIAQSVRPRPIVDVAADLGLAADDIDQYGKYKAKLPLDLIKRPVRGRLVLVTAISPTPAGEGKSTVSVGLAQALRKIGKRPMSVEGLPHGNWVLMDFGDVVVHVFQDDARSLYDIEGLWLDARRIPVPIALPAQN